MEENKMSEVYLKAKVHITGKIEVVTGLSIGSSGGTLEIGGVDKPIIRNPLNNEPYIPGSSLKGKIRSLLEKYLGKELSEIIGGRNRIRIHLCKEEKNDYNDCPICMIFGSSQTDVNMPTRLIVRDSFLIEGKIKDELQEKGDLPFSEIKTETIIDRITAQAMPRDLERIPAGAEFSLDLIFDVYNEKDVDFLIHLFQGLKLLEDDYLGGSGTRGSGQIKFVDLSVDIKDKKYYESGKFKEDFKKINDDAITIEEILQKSDEIKKKLKTLIK